MIEKNINTLIISPSMYRSSLYLPIIHGVLRTFCRQNPTIERHVHWLDPVYVNESPDLIFETYKDIDIDVVGFSCYEWNYDLNVELARRLKAERPNCLIVFGGPHPNWNDSDIFLKHPYIDIIVMGSGEYPFEQILLKKIQGSSSYEGISSTIVNSNQKRVVTKQQSQSVSSVNQKSSPWLDNSELWDRIIEKCHEKNQPIWALWETNRGCPYSCSYCDWGSATNQKIRAFDQDRMLQEAEWFVDHKVDDIFIADANFGILSRDRDFAKHLVDYKLQRKSKYPHQVFFNLPKNNPERTLDLTKIFVEGRLIKYSIPVDFQTFNSKALDIIDRSNIKIERHKELVRLYLKERYPIAGSVILGVPGETYKSFTRSIGELLALGFHEEVRVFMWGQLPNAPSSHPNYIAKYKLETINRYTYYARLGCEDAKNPLQGRSEYLVSTVSYNRQDYLDMMLFSVFVKAFHNFSLSRYLAIYLHFSENVSYEHFYEKLLDFFSSHPGVIKLRAKIESWLVNEDEILAFQYGEELPYLLNLEEFLFACVLEKEDILSDHFGEFLSKYYELTPLLKDLLKYQKEILVSPCYKSHVGKSFQTDYNWQKYFHETTRLSQYQRVAPPDKIVTRYFIKDSNLGYKKHIHLKVSNSDKYGFHDYIKAVLGPMNNRNFRTSHLVESVSCL